MQLSAPSASQLEGGTFWTTAQVTLDGQGVELPVSAGKRVWQADQWPSTQVTGLQIPRLDDTDRDVWDAGLVGSDGHRLILTGHAIHGGDVWTWGLGEYLITKARPAAADITLEAADLVEAVVKHEYRTARGVHASARPVEIIASMLAEDRIDFWWDPSLPLPTVRRGFALGTDRGEALQDLATMWGAHIAPHENGGLGAYRIPTGSVAQPDVVFSDDPGDNAEHVPVIESVLELDRADIANHILVPVRDSDKIAEAYQVDGKYGVGRYGWQSRRLDSNAVGHWATAQGMAKIELAKSLLRTVTRPVEAVPDHRIVPYTPVEIRTHEDGIQRGRITGIEQPLTAGETAVYHVGMEI